VYSSIATVSYGVELAAPSAPVPSDPAPSDPAPSAPLASSPSSNSVKEKNSSSNSSSNSNSYSKFYSPPSPLASSLPVAGVVDVAGVAM
jgi:hypothetical protein